MGNQVRYGDIIREEIVPGFTLVRMFNPSMFPDVYKAEGDNPERALFSLLKRYNDIKNDGVQGLLTRYDGNCYVSMACTGTNKLINQQ